jgi:hypothetical protein
MGSTTSLTTSFDELSNRNGLFYLNSCVSTAQITDGTSNTLAVGECRLELSDTGHVGALWAGMRGTSDEPDDDAEGATYVSDTMWWINSDPTWCINGLGVQAFSSNHPCTSSTRALTARRSSGWRRGTTACRLASIELARGADFRCPPSGRERPDRAESINVLIFLSRCPALALRASVPFMFPNTCSSSNASVII